MITLQQVQGLAHNSDVRYALPNATKCIEARVMGRPNGYPVKVKIGFNGEHTITEANATHYHLPGQCPCATCGAKHA